MTEVLAQGRLVPSIVSRAASDKEESFARRFGDTLLLLVALKGDSGELQAGLVGAEGAAQGQLQPRINVLGYHTVVGDEDTLVRGTPAGNVGSMEATALAQLLGGSPYFAIALRKRSDEGTFLDRVTVGRAVNKDVVLRHRSVSKFHAWFEVDEMGAFFVADAGSKNGTVLNGTSLPARELVIIGSGDKLRVGSVETVVASPDIFWRALRA